MNVTFESQHNRNLVYSFHLIGFLFKAVLNDECSGPSRKACVKLEHASCDGRSEGFDGARCKCDEPFIETVHQKSSICVCPPGKTLTANKRSCEPGGYLSECVNDSWERKNYTHLLQRLLNRESVSKLELLLYAGSMQIYGIHVYTWIYIIHISDKKIKANVDLSFYTAKIGGDCSTPINQKACIGLDFATCDAATSKCKCLDGFESSPSDLSACRCKPGLSLVRGNKCEPRKLYVLVKVNSCEGNKSMTAGHTLMSQLKRLFK